MVEVIQVQFPLQRDFMVCLKEIGSEGCFWTIGGCRMPAHVEELAVTLAGHVACTTPAKSDLQFVPTVHINNGELMRRGIRRACITTMPKMEYISE